MTAPAHDIVVALATRWSVGDDFMRWLDTSVVFHNTLVDRIVPGKPTPQRVAELEEVLGYRDDLLTVCEPYRLFAIEAPTQARDRLAFAAADPGVVIGEDIEPYRLRKVRLLNGAHSLLAPLALQCGATTVLDAVIDDDIGEFLRRVMFDELVPACEASGAGEFAAAVLDRFANPCIAHALIDIMLHATAKTRVRVVPSIIAYTKQRGQSPELTSFAFASFLVFQQEKFLESRRASGLSEPADDGAPLIRELWRAAPAAGTAERERIAAFVDAVCAEQSLWGADLHALPGFIDSVTTHMSAILDNGARPSLAQLLSRSSATVVSDVRKVS